MRPETAHVACRLIHDTATMLLWGAFAYLAALVPRELGAALGERLTAFLRGASLIAALSTVVALPIEVAAIGDGGWGDVADPATIRAVLFETSVGRAWQVQAAAAAVLITASVLAPSRRRLGAAAAGAGLLLATLATTGHAAMHEGWLGVAHRANDVVHVLAGGAWLGALVPLVLILKAFDDPARRRDAGTALRRFSTAGHAAVAIVIVTGAANMVLILGGWPPDWSSPYPALLGTKIAVVLVMTALALFNRYGLVPRMTTRRRQSLRLLWLATLTEIGLGVAAIALVSLFGTLEPP